MRSSLRRLRELAIRCSETKERRNHRSPAKVDELARASQDIQELKSYYDGLLSAAAATANSAYEFSVALHEMGTCLLEKITINDDENGGQVSLMLGKAQFELQRHVDNYRSNIIRTITTPSERLLRELQIVEDMKQQCDDKRDWYKFMLTASQQNERLRNRKGNAFTPKQLQAAREDYEMEANSFIFRLESLKQGQSRSLFTQAARHHAAQLNLFRKGFKSLEMIEPHVKFFAEQQHVDYHFSELENDNMDSDRDGGSCHDDSSDDEELSFHYGLNELADDALSMHRNSFVENEPVPKTQTELLYRHQKPGLGSQSEPIYTDRNFNLSDKINKIPPPSTRKFHTYVLPTPVDVKNSTSTETSSSFDSLEINGSSPTQMPYSSSLDPHKSLKFGEKNFPKDSNFRNNPTKALFSHQFTSYSTSEAKNATRHAFSSPISQKSVPGKPFFASTGSKPGISELHKLPRPPISLAAYSAPLVTSDQDTRMFVKVISPASKMASPLPAPPALLRCFSIPYRGPRTPLGALNMLFDTPRNLKPVEDTDSPPLTALSLKAVHNESMYSHKLSS